jgi:hypothetical protein
MLIESENLWLRIRPVLERFAAGVVSANPSLMQSIANITNDAFFLRAYLSFRKHNDGNDIAISVEAILAGDQLNITTDICWDDGEVLAVGPSSKLSVDNSRSSVVATANEWVIEFEKFLQAQEANILKVALELS